MLLPPAAVEQISNIQTWLVQANAQELNKYHVFYAVPGTTFYVPFGWVALSGCISKPLVETFLGNDSAAKETIKKTKGKTTDHIGVYLVQPVFDSQLHKATEATTRTYFHYAWAQGAVYIPRSWTSSEAVKSHMEAVTPATDLPAAAKKVG